MINTIYKTLYLLKKRQYVELLERLLVKVTVKTKFISSWPSFLFYNRFYILSKNKWTPQSGNNNIVIRSAGIQDIPALERFIRKKNDLNERFIKKHIGILAEINHNIVGMIWLELSNIHYELKDQFYFKLPFNAGWAYDVYISEDYRGKGVLNSLQNELFRQLNENSKKKAYCLVEALNHDAVRVHKLLGYTFEKEVVCFGILRAIVHININTKGAKKLNGSNEAGRSKKQ